MQDYYFSGDGDSMIVSSAGYILSALVGVIVGGSLLYFIGKKVVKN
jgi:cobalt/nickel transport system permease protein/cobalt/nickel transport protein